MNEALQAQINMRMEEAQAYQNNIDTFKNIAAMLPNELPEHLAAYRGRTDKHAAAAEINDLDDVQLLADVWFRDECTARIRSEMVELRKVQAILLSLESQANS